MTEQKQYYDRILQKLQQYTEVTDEQIGREIDELLAAADELTLEEREEERGRLWNRLRGFGEVEELLADPEVTEVMINGSEAVFYEKNGCLYRWNREIEAESLRELVLRMVGGANRMVNTLSPIADARLPDGSRVNVVLPPASLIGPVVTIRRFGEPLPASRLVEYGMLSEDLMAALLDRVAMKRNFFISGATGSGKSTLLGGLAEGIPQSERIITIEDTAELRLRHCPNLVRLEAQLQGERSRITIRELIRTALRMRPDRIIVGEVRGEEVIDLLQAMNTGHAGSLSTGHAGSPIEVLGRLETMFLMGMEMPVSAIRRQIASAIDIIIQVARQQDGSRRVTEIARVGEWREQGIELETLVYFDSRRREWILEKEVSEWGV
ncbi:MAG: ATPase, T2SS/T4P/T4SS family [Lachnospiraceae bacterium]|nr:ATPase, T2SS/T4P/T4SS family [Lachnospiraceae bacterium]MDY5742810.1 ATPase, T2SS/T4P/T4SS family [Lachnospiraceae bacterium]